MKIWPDDGEGMNKEQLLKRLDKNWETLLKSYSGLSDYEMTQATGMEEWTVKDIIAHVTWWEEEALIHLPTILAGGKPPRYSVLYGGIDAFNALMIEKKRKTSLSEVLRLRDETHHRLIDFLKKIPEDRFIPKTQFRHRLRLDTYSHYSKHAEAIRKNSD